MVQDKSSAVANTECCAIIPALNEEQRITHILETALGCGVFSDVLVVDDGSSDATGVVAQRCGARVVRHEQNRGKALAMLTGLNHTKAPLVCFLDADLIAVTPAHLIALVAPVRQEEAKATLGVFRGGRIATGLAQWIAPMISGQRCLSRKLLVEFNSWDSGYGIETAINSFLLSKGIRQRIVYWHGAAQIMKEEKWGFIRGTRTRLKMIYEVILAWVKTTIHRIIIRCRKKKC